MRIGYKFDQMKKQGPSVKCERCNLSYFQKHNDKCPHCAELNDQELKLLRVKHKNEAIANASLGRKMGVGAVLCVFITFLIFAFSK